MNELKYELFKLALSKSEDEIKNAIDVTQKLLLFLEIEKPVEVKNQRPFIDIINEKIESDKTLKDPLKKEYTRHLLISNFINNELKVGIEKLCLDIDKKLGVSAPKEFCTDQLSKIFMESLEVDGDKCVMSSKGYESSFVEEKDRRPLKKPTTILTGIEEKDKEILTELIEKYDNDVESSNVNIKNNNKGVFHPNYPPGQICKKPVQFNTIYKEKVFDTAKTEKEVLEKIRDISETI